MKERLNTELINNVDKSFDSPDKVIAPDKLKLERLLCKEAKNIKERNAEDLKGELLACLAGTSEGEKSYYICDHNLAKVDIVKYMRQTDITDCATLVIHNCLQSIITLLMT